jgi:hypothetical protein
MKYLSSILILVLLNVAIFAQQKKSISGFVYDKSTGEILIGATILCNKMVAVTNEYGFYSIKIPVTDEKVNITASFVGYSPKTIPVQNLKGKQAAIQGEFFKITKLPVN